MATAQEASTVDSVSEGYFDSLPATKSEANGTVIECANALCSARKAISKELITAVVDSGSSADKVVRRLQFGVQILREYNITDKIDESMIEAGRRELSDYTRYIPLIGSFNNLCEAACGVKVSNPDPTAVKEFIFAALAFGMEIAIWTIGAPYKMAWRGTRFIANRTFLRYARHGCSGCIALAMSELHWAIRGAVYGDVVTESNVEFVWNQIQELKQDAEEWNYDVELDYTYSEIEDLVGSESAGGGGIPPQEQEGPIEQYIPDFEMPEFDFELQSLNELLQ